MKRPHVTITPTNYHGIHITLSEGSITSNLSTIITKREANAIESLLLALHSERSLLNTTGTANAIATTLDAIGNAA